MPRLPTLIRVFRAADRVVCKGGVSAAAGLAALLAGTPLTIVHEMAGPYWHPGKDLKTRLTNVIRHWVFRRAHDHIGVSANCLLTKNLPHGSISRVIYNPVDPTLHPGPQRAAKDSVIDVLYVGRLLESKGILVLASALRRLDEAGVALRAAFVGTGPDRPALERALAACQNVHVELTGPLRHYHLGHMYQAARMVVVPSSTHPEGMGLVIAEALSFGKPVIGSDQPVIQEVMGEGGLTFFNGDDQDLSVKIRSLLTDSNRYDALAEGARQRAPTFSTQRYRHELLRLTAAWSPMPDNAIR